MHRHPPCHWVQHYCPGLRVGSSSDEHRVVACDGIQHTNNVQLCISEVHLVGQPVHSNAIYKKLKKAKLTLQLSTAKLKRRLGSFATSYTLCI